MIYVGKTARQVRESLGLTQHELAERLGITNVHLSHIENNKAYPSPALLARFQELFEIDLYVVAWCLYGDTASLPKAVRESADRLAQAWKEKLGEVIARHRNVRAV
ncbi:helix-turn-helix domain-containing protein [Singulisphaera sp. PoT]|uniref:helix-turn-helix domain-containing protein n=1 Tax=Singulisphaera sp. PoT TaxID=3411797 RepID=UPI003BF58F3C